MALTATKTELSGASERGLSSSLFGAFGAAAQAMTVPPLVNGMSISGDRDAIRNEQNAGAAARAGSGELSTSAGASGAEATRKAHLAAQNKDAKDQRNRLFLIQMMQLQDELNQILADIDIRLTEISDMENGIQEIFDEGHAKTKIDSDGNTVLENEQAEKALREYEESTGKKIDRKDSSAVIEALQKQMEEFAKEREKLFVEQKKIYQRQEENKASYASGDTYAQEKALKDSADAIEDYMKTIKREEQIILSDVDMTLKSEEMSLSEPSF